MKNIILLIFSSLFMGQSIAQEWVVDSNQVDYQVRNIYIDPLSNRYLVSEDMQIIKYKPDGSFWNRFENNRLGIIGSIDVTNPFQVLVFYPQYQILILLDNNLSETGRINFNSIGFGNIRTAGISDDNNIWILDEGSRKLSKINTSGKVKFEGIPYFGFDIFPDKPIHIQQKSNFVYVSQEGQKIQVFDIFGKWVKFIDPGDVQSIVYVDEYLYYSDGTNIIEYPLNAMDLGNELQKIAMNDTRSLTYDVVSGKFYGLNKDNKIVYFSSIK